MNSWDNRAPTWGAAADLTRGESRKAFLTRVYGLFTASVLFSAIGALVALYGGLSSSQVSLSVGGSRVAVPPLVAFFGQHYIIAALVMFGAVIGGSLWGFYWVLTGLVRMHAAEAFAALRIQNYKNFLRIKVEKDKLTIYPLAVDRIPGADDWMNAPRGKANPQPTNPKLIAVKPIDVRLIENPIVIHNYDETYE